MKTRAAVFAATLVAALLLATCSNSVDLVQELSREVKVKKNLYLVVQDFAPAAAATEVNPEAPVTIAFDRAVDENTLTAANIAVSPATGWFDTPLDLSYDYSPTNRTLTVAHSVYFDTSRTYTVTISSGVKGADGSELREQLSWSFKTGVVPLGTVTIEGGAAFVDDNGKVTLSLTYNDIVDKMRFGTTQAAALSATWESASSSWSFDLLPGDGERFVYVQFRDEQSGTVSALWHDSIVRDTTAPSVSVSADNPGYVGPATNGSRTLAVAATDAGSGVASYSWTKTGGPGTVSFGSAGAAATTVTASAEGAYTLAVTATDALGWESDPVTAGFTWDATAPSVEAGSAGGYLSGAVTSTTIVGAAASDASGVASHLWTATGPGSIAIGDPASLTTSVSDATEDGVYTLTLTATDEAGNTATDTVAVTRDSTPPSVDAGAGKVINADTPGLKVTLAASSTDDLSGVAAQSWSTVDGPGTVDFADASVEDATVSASQDGTYTLRLTVTDHAGNSGSSTTTLVRDTVPPAAPTVSGSAATLDSTPTWTWTGGGGGDGTFRYKLDSSDFSTAVTTSALSYTPPVQSDGSHTLYVRERDAAGNWSSSGSRSILVTPILPYDDQTNVSRSVTLQWRSAGKGATYKIYGGATEGTMELRATQTTTTFSPGLLPSSTYFYWYYTSTYSLETRRYPSSGSYRFRTGVR